MIVVKRWHKAGALYLKALEKSEISDGCFSQLMQALIHPEGDMHVLVLLYLVTDHADN
jgi:hypothetical protein